MTKTAKDRDRALAMAKPETTEAEAEVDGDANMEDADETPEETVGSKVIVIHVGSQNLRIGLSSDALPKTVPMVIARKSKTNESEDHDEPRPKRMKREDGTEEEPENQFGPEVCHTKYRVEETTWTVANRKLVVCSFQQDVIRTQSAHATE